MSLGPDPDEVVYHPRDAISSTAKTTAVTTLAGTTASAIQNTLTKQNVGAMGIFTRYGGTIAVFAAMGASYEFVKCASANLREKDDHWNTTLGAFFSGSMVGLKKGTLPAFLGYGAALAVIAGVYDYTGGSLSGYRKDPDVDEVARKEFLRKNRRRPIEETLANLGEGRGIHGPGYEERRRQRIKENYRIDLPPPNAPTHS
ncbi:hypothetical protein EV356DRAFT_528073 [Viridothelium virens]|uniref:NADH-ubiquinone oxidoreductase 213 kDa subunit n=1 Tax=Viridothelium virens TaxID=1048519 RepID=A0A6A6HMW7_VIRVR|nr:hypothetical protein EV356DRAFT_528073 [Viridothelium virens]